MANTQLSPEQILAALSQVQEPILKQDLVALDAIRDLEIQGANVKLRLVLIAPLHPLADEIEASVRQAVMALDGVETVDITLDAEVPSDGRPREGSAVAVRNVIAVASGKGGVGKSTVAVNLAVALSQAGARVGLLDADVYGPNVPTMMGVERLPVPSDDSGRLTPAEAFGVKLMSIGFLVKPEQAMVWRGPMLHNAVRQFIQDVEWGELDYLLVDMPPGTGDVQLSLAQTTPLSGGLIVTLPQKVSVDDARRGVEMFRQMQIPILGVVENMSFMELPDGQKMDVFGSGGGAKLAEEFNTSYIGGIPLDPEVRVGGDSGEPIVVRLPDSSAAKALHAIAADVALKVSLAAIASQSAAIPIRMVDE